MDRSTQQAGSAAVAEADLRATFAMYPTGITVVSSCAGDQPHAMTAGSFTSVSLNPPLVLVCVRCGSATGEMIGRAGGFAISVLAEGQERLARRFADPRRPPGRAQFSTVEWLPAPATRAPVLADCLAWFDCVLHAVTRAGDHDVLFGRVVWTSGRKRGEPLLRFAGAYRPLPPRAGGPS